MPRMREAIRSGWNTSRPSIFSDTPANLIGAPVTARTDSAAPPRASPSSLVSTTPVSGSASRNALRGVDRVLARHRVDDEQRLDRRHRRVQRGDLLHHRLVDREPARGVDDQHVVIVRPRPLERAPRDRRPARRRGRREHVDADLRARASRAARSPRAGRRRRRSRSTFFFCSRNRRASFAAVVVLPAPCRPASRITAGGRVARSSGAAASPISARQLAVHDADERLARRERARRPPRRRACSRTRATKSLTTGSATSASSSARRTSRSASAMLASVRRASPRSVLTTRDSRWVRLSSMGRGGARAEGALRYTPARRTMILLHLAAAATLRGRRVGPLARPRPAAGDAVRCWSRSRSSLHAVAFVAGARDAATGSTCRSPHALSIVAALTVLVAGADRRARHAAGDRRRRAAGRGGRRVLLPALAPSTHRFPYAGAPWAIAHIAVALLAYAFFIVAAAQALVMTGLEKRLHRGLAEDADPTPPLLTLERALFRLIAVGFVLLSLALASGASVLRATVRQARSSSRTRTCSRSPRGWCSARCVVGRWRYGWRGRKALRWILGGHRAADPRLPRQQVRAGSHSRALIGRGDVGFQGSEVGTP